MAGGRRILLEVAVASVDGAIAAQQAGADRIELNSALELGGLTPSAGLLRETLGAVRIPVIVMLRPRPGGFVCSEAEFTTLRRDGDYALMCGAAGVAFGALTADRQIDPDRMRTLARQFAGTQTVFHRAFDALADQRTGIEQLVALGIGRVLTSGGCASAIEGAQQIAQLAEMAAGRIEILPGAGIRSDNVADLVRRTGCTQVHGSFSRHREDAASPAASGSHLATDGRQIAAARAALDAL